MYILHTLHNQYNLYFFFFFNDTATTEIYTLSLHDALPILRDQAVQPDEVSQRLAESFPLIVAVRSEEHTSELQSRLHLVCRLLLEKKKKILQIETWVSMFEC